MKSRRLRSSSRGSLMRGPSEYVRALLEIPLERTGGDVHGNDRQYDLARPVQDRFAVLHGGKAQRAADMMTAAGRVPSRSRYAYARVSIQRGKGSQVHAE